MLRPAARTLVFDPLPAAIAHRRPAIIRVHRLAGPHDTRLDPGVSILLCGTGPCTVGICFGASRFVGDLPRRFARMRALPHAWCV